MIQKEARQALEVQVNNKLVNIKWEKIDTYTEKIIHTFIDNQGRYYELIEMCKWKPLNYANKYIQCSKSLRK